MNAPGSLMIAKTMKILGWARRAEVAQFGLKALLAGTLVNLSNAAIAGVVAG